MDVDTDSIIALMSFLVGSYIFISKNVKFPTKKELEERYKKEHQRKKEEEKIDRDKDKSKLNNLIDSLFKKKKEKLFL